MTFQEKGYWFADQHPDINFSNTFRWTLDLQASLITLEHLRYGTSRPVFLFHLTSIGPNRLESVEAHLCNEDTYSGNILWSSDQVIFHWKIIGPNKNEKLIYYYC